MSSGLSSNPPANKLAAFGSTSNYNQSPAPINIDASSKRSSSSGGFGAASATRLAPQARNQQPLRKQHKAQKRAKLADDDAMAEATAMRPFNSRRGQTSITHLMNFSLPPRPHFQHHHYPNSHRHQRRNPTWGLGSGYHAVDKARYVHANYRFIVRPDREYHAQAVDADVHVAWESVLQILCSVETQATSCPICLSPPVASRMAKCGHIFCLPCLIRYMHSTDDNTPVPEKRARWKKCPICEDSVFMSETRPVRWLEGQEAGLLREDGDVLLRLLTREPGSTLALPRDAADNHVHHDDIPWYHVAEMMDYARFMKGGEDYMTAQHDQEIAELGAQEKEDELMFGDENTWTRKAVNAIEETKQKLIGMGNPPSAGTSATATDSEVPQSWEDEDDDRKTDSELQTGLASAVQAMSLSASATSNHHPISAQHSRSNKPGSHPFYFYNARPNFYLSPLDIRILKTAFGEFSAFPTTVLPRVEHISTGHVVDDDIRKRAKYLAHLPYGCEVSFLECDWTDVISPTFLDQYKDDILRRRKKNHEKEAREERDRLRAEKEEDDKRMASIRRRRPSIAEKSFSQTEFHPLAHREALGSSPGDSTLASTPPWGHPRTHSSFATLATPGTSPDTQRTVWGTTAIPPTSPSLVAAPEPPPPADDGWLQGWEKDLLDEGDAVAMVEASLNEDRATSRTGAGSNVHGGTKKGKKKKITLMSTNARRGA